MPPSIGALEARAKPGPTETSQSHAPDSSDSYAKNFPDTLSSYPHTGIGMQEQKSEQQIRSEKLAKAILKWLVDHEPLSWSHFLQAVGSIFFWRSETLMEAARQEILTSLAATTARIENISETDPEKNLALWGHVSHLLSVMPYLELPEGLLIRVPLMSCNQWQVLNMRVGRVALNPFGSPSIAYTLTPEPESKQRNHSITSVDEKKIPGSPPSALILFMGTAPPTSLGALVSLWSDFVPFTMVGQALYRAGEGRVQEQITRWNDHPYEKKRKIIAVGQSLGGALAQLCCAHHPHQVEAVAINAPKVNREIYEKMKRNIGSKDLHTQVQRFNHEHDWICRVGTHLLPGTQSYLFGHHKQVELSEENQVRFRSLRRHGSMIFNAHTKIFPVHLGARIEKVNYQEPESTLMNRLHQLGCFLFFLPLTLLLAIRALQCYILKQVKELWEEHRDP